MTVHQLPRPALAGWVADARRAVREAGGVPLGSLPGGEVESALAELAALEAQVAALRLAVLVEADRRRLAEVTGAADTSAWAARLTGSNRAVISGGLWLARRLEECYDHTRVAFARGQISVDQVRVIVKAADRLPAQVSAAQRAEPEAGMVAKAVGGLNPRRLRLAGRRMLERIDRELADRHEADPLEDEEERAEVETWLSLHDNGDGTFSGRFTIPELHGHLLRTALERLSAPRRLSRNKAGQPVVDDTLPGGADNLSWTERLGAAFCELLEHLPRNGHAPVGVTLLVGISLRRLRENLASARLDTGATVSPGQARRLGCGAGIVPVVLGGDSEPLDLGRERRLHTASMRRALSFRYDTCAAEGCERPFAWCEIHHPDPWASGGATSLDNAVPLCWHHHRRAHDRRYRIRYLGTGEVRKPPHPRT